MKYLVSCLKTVCVILILSATYQRLNTPIYSVTMTSSGYIIESANVSDAAGNKSSTNYNLSDTIGQLAAGQFSSSGYIIKAGFQYLRTITPFSFTVTNININFGTVTSGIPATGTTNLIVTYGGGGGLYQVTAAELGPLSNPNGSTTIPDTSCDGGINTCTAYVAKPWTSSSAYGFGYNMSGQDIPTDFTDATYYREFSDRTLSETPAVVMTSPNVGKNRTATVTFKLNPSGSQAAGTYQTVINFVATPSY